MMVSCNWILARTYSRIGALVEELESTSEALQHFAHAEEIYRKLESAPSRSFDSQREHAENLNALGLAFTKVGRHADAADAFAKALEIQTEATDRNMGHDQRVDLALTKTIWHAAAKNWQTERGGVGI